MLLLFLVVFGPKRDTHVDKVPAGISNYPNSETQFQLRLELHDYNLNAENEGRRILWASQANSIAKLTNPWFHNRDCASNKK